MKKQSDIRQIPIAQIVLPEKTIAPRDLRRMMISITQDGLKAPVVVEPRGSAFLVVDGLKRVLACRELDIKDIPVVVREPVAVDESPAPKQPESMPKAMEPQEPIHTREVHKPKSKTVEQHAEPESGTVNQELLFEQENGAGQVVPVQGGMPQRNMNYQQNSNMPLSVESALSSITTLQQIPHQMEKLVTLLERQREVMQQQKPSPLLYTILLIGLVILGIGAISIVYELKSGVSSQQAMTKDTKDELDKLSKDAAVFNSEIKSNIQQAQEKFAAINQKLEQSNKAAEEQASKQWNVVSSMETKFSGLAGKIDAAVGDMKENLSSDMLKRIQDKQDAINKSIEQLKKNNVDSQDNSGMIDKLQAELDGLAAEINGYKKDMEDKNREITRLKAELEQKSRELRDKKKTPSTPPEDPSPFEPRSNSRSGEGSNNRNITEGSKTAPEPIVKDVPKRALYPNYPPSGLIGPKGY